MKRRPRRGAPAAVVALVVLAAAALTAVVTIQLLLGEPPWVSYDWSATTLHSTRWRDTAVLVAGIVAALVGLLMLLAALLPGRPTVLPLRDNESGLDTGAARRGLLRTLKTAAGSVDGVTSANVRLSRRRVRALARTNRFVTEGLDEAVRTAVEQRLAEVGPVGDLTVRARIRTTRSGK